MKLYPEHKQIKVLKQGSEGTLIYSHLLMLQMGRLVFIGGERLTQES